MSRELFKSTSFISTIDSNTVALKKLKNISFHFKLFSSSFLCYKVITNPKTFSNKLFQQGSRLSFSLLSTAYETYAFSNYLLFPPKKNRLQIQIDYEFQRGKTKPTGSRHNFVFNFGLSLVFPLDPLPKVVHS